MRIYPTEFLYHAGQDVALDDSFAQAETYGKVKLGRNELFFKGTLRWYVVPFDRVLRIFRQQDHVYGKLCAGGQDYDVHLLMLVLDDGSPLQLHIGNDRPMLLKAEQLYAAIQAAQPQLQYGKL